MAVPTTRAQFKDYCLRKLGAPVVEINVDDDQIDDRIDEALKFYWDYHYDGSEKVYYKKQVTQTDIDNKYITLPDNILGVAGIFDIGSSITQGGMFNIQYQIALNDLYTLTNQSIVPYFMAFQHISLLQQILVGSQPIRFNHHTNKVHIDMDWAKVNVGDYLVLECTQVLDPDAYTAIWGDRWLQNYATALIGVNWGTNLTKFSGIQMAGGVTFNGAEMLARYKGEVESLEQDMIYKFSLPVDFRVG